MLKTGNLVHANCDYKQFTLKLNFNYNDKQITAGHIINYNDDKYKYDISKLKLKKEKRNIYVDCSSYP
jgi:hypothetical protein